MSKPSTMTRRELLRSRVFGGVARAVSAAAGTAGAVASDGPQAMAAHNNDVLNPPADPTPPPGVEPTSEMKLPELNQAILDPQTLANLFRDIQSLTKVLEVIPKYAANAYVGQTSISLEEGHRLLRNRKVRAIQIRYIYEDAQWWDTLVDTPAGVRVVRIRHTFDGSAAVEPMRK